jgi:uncharacterized protein (TIGR02147 family)
MLYYFKNLKKSIILYIAMNKKPEVYEFLDYREYLKAYYEFNKKKDAQFSHRIMARKMGFTSPNFLKLVIDKERNIGKSSLQKIIKGLGLKKKEAEYFSYLVFFIKAKTRIEKNYYYSLISSLRSKKIISPIQKDQFKYYNDWYNIVIRELINNQPVDVDYTEIAKKIIPPVLPKQVKKSIKILEELGLIERTKNGRFVQSSPLINTGNEVESLLLKNFHDKMIELGRLSLEQFPSEKREISSCTVKISEKGFKRLKARLQEFREEVLQIVKEDDKVDRIAQVNFQLFPLSVEVLHKEGEK